MAAPLPTGFTVPVMPVAPNIGDPRSFAMDTQGALAAQQVGLQIGQELANLENKKAQRALEAEKIKLELQKNRVDKMLADEAVAYYSNPETVSKYTNAVLGAREAEARFAASKANTGILANEVSAQKSAFERKIGENVYAAPGTQAAGEKALATQLAVAGRTPEETEEAVAAARKRGEIKGLVEAAGGSESPGGSAVADEAMRKLSGVSDWENVDEADPDTGAVYRTRIRRDPQGKVVASGERNLLHLPSGAKSAGAIAKETAELIQLSDVASKLDKVLTEYEQTGNAGVLQGMASQLASTPATGLFSLLKKYVGQWAQTKDTAKIAAEVQNFSNAVGNGLFGASLTANESRKLEQAVPSAADIANPETLRTKLKATQDFFNEKIKSAGSQGVVGPSGKPISVRQAAEKKAAEAPKAPDSIAEKVKRRETVYYNGLPYRLNEAETALVPVAPGTK